MKKKTSRHEHKAQQTKKTCRTAADYKSRKNNYGQLSIAVCITIGIICSIPLSQAFADISAQTTNDSQTIATRVMENVLSTDEILSLAQPDIDSNQIASSQNQVSNVFNEEAIDTTQYQSPITNAQQTIIGFIDTKDAANSFASLSRELTNKGWSLCESGSELCASFIKDSGNYTWLYLSCSALGDTTSVVIQTTESASS